MDLTSAKSVVANSNIVGIFTPKKMGEDEVSPIFNEQNIFQRGGEKPPTSHENGRIFYTKEKNYLFLTNIRYAACDRYIREYGATRIRVP